MDRPLARPDAPANVSPIDSPQSSPILSFVEGKQTNTAREVPVHLLGRGLLDS